MNAEEVIRQLRRIERTIATLPPGAHIENISIRRSTKIYEIEIPIIEVAYSYFAETFDGRAVYVTRGQNEYGDKWERFEVEHEGAIFTTHRGPRREQPRGVRDLISFTKEQGKNA